MYSTSLGSCVLKASVVQCLSVPSIDPQWTSISTSPSILSLTVDWHLSQKLVDSINTKSQMWVSWHSANYHQTDDKVVDRVSIKISANFTASSAKYQMRCPWSVDRESIRGIDQYSHTVAFSTHNCKSVVNICMYVGPSYSLAQSIGDHPLMIM